MLPAHVLLINARLRILDEDRWTPGYLALTAKGRGGTAVLPHDPSATCWCAMGAVAAEAGEVTDDFNDVFPLHRESNNTYAEQVEFYRAIRALDEATHQVIEELYNRYHDIDPTLYNKVDAMFGYENRVFEANDRLGHEIAIKIFNKAIDNLYDEAHNGPLVMESVFDKHIDTAA